MEVEITRCYLYIYAEENIWDLDIQFTYENSEDCKFYLKKILVALKIRITTFRAFIKKTTCARSLSN